MLLTFFFSIVTMLATNTEPASCSINCSDDGPITVLKTHTSSLSDSLFSAASSSGNSNSFAGMVVEGPITVLKTLIFVSFERITEMLACVEESSLIESKKISCLNSASILINKREEIAYLGLKNLKPGPTMVLKNPNANTLSYLWTA